MSNISKFNIQLDNLLVELGKLFSDNMEIKIFREKFALVKTANPRLVILLFLKYVYPYKEHIFSKNELFFLSDDLLNEIKKNEDIKKEAKVDDDYIITKAIDFKKFWYQMTPQQQNTIWKYFQVLIVLSERYVADQTK